MNEWMWNKRNDDDDFVQASVNIMQVFIYLFN